MLARHGSHLIITIMDGTRACLKGQARRSPGRFPPHCRTAGKRGSVMGERWEMGLVVARVCGLSFEVPARWKPLVINILNKQRVPLA